MNKAKELTLALNFDPVCLTILGFELENTGE